MKRQILLPFFVLFFCCSYSHAFSDEAHWNAKWITVPGASANGYGIYYFRKSVDFSTKPSMYSIKVSGDNRYKLFVNGTLVSLGPARGDLYYWNYETVDIAPYLQQGKNVVAAVVWNDGPDRPEGQISNRTGFVLCGATDAENAFNTNTSWKCIENKAYEPLTGIGYNTYYVAGPGELVDMHKTIQGWVQNNFDDAGWQNAKQVGWQDASVKGEGDISGWMLVPSILPQMELTKQRLQEVKHVTGMRLPGGFPKQQTAFTVPANTTVDILLDQSFLTDAYTTLEFSKGNNATITIGYAEALYENTKEMYPMHKGNRNETDGKVFRGRRDSIISSGADHQQFTTLSWRTFRFIHLVIHTANEPLTIDDMYDTFTGYPFKLNATLQTSNTELNKIMEIGWRTARSCAMETYMDCPYYEQLQYIGDSRIQALISLYNSGDDRLVRNALNEMDHSRIAEGITLSRHPSFSPQEIPTFSLWYIGMLHDYWMYRGDSAFIADKLQGARNVLWFYSKYQQADGSLRNVPYWMFTDWVDGWKGWSGGTAPYGKDGSSSVLDLQLLWALQLAADMEQHIGMKAYAAQYTAAANKLQQTIKTKYWNAAKKCFADTDDKDVYSQHANTLAILTNTISGADAKMLAEKLLSDTTLAPASIYFKYYLHMACTKAGLGNNYLQWLDIWRKNIEMGMTTWAEISNIDETRSDCHAWGASPNIEFFRTVLGIDADAPGFSKVKIEPHLGNITEIGGSIPHPAGKLSVNYKLQNDVWKVNIVLPAKITGKFYWKGKEYALQAGENNLQIK